MIFEIDLPERFHLISIDCRSHWPAPDTYRVLVSYHAPEFHFLSFLGGATYPNVLGACEAAYTEYFKFSAQRMNRVSKELPSGLDGLNIEIDL